MGGGGRSGRGAQPAAQITTEGPVSGIARRRATAVASATPKPRLLAPIDLLRYGAVVTQLASHRRSGGAIDRTHRGTP